MWETGESEHKLSSAPDEVARPEQEAPPKRAQGVQSGNAPSPLLASPRRSAIA